MTSLSSIQIPTYMANVFKYGITIILIFITLSIVVKCSCFIYETIMDVIRWHKIDDDDDEEFWNDDDDDEDWKDYYNDVDSDDDDENDDEEDDF